MIAAFGQTFCPGDLRGWRAAQFEDREDRFQQLVGDGLREAHGASAHVSPTLGRDGSIDAWVESPVEGCGLLGNLEGPVIIECKDHRPQANWAKTWKNVLGGWNDVRAKLLEQAKVGFHGKHEPWRRARSYVYCVSISIPDQRSKDELTSVIRSFLLTIAPNITNVVVCEWGSLSFWLNSYRRVADSWIGVGHPAIKEHGEYVKSLTGFRQYLLNEHLAYEAPDVRTDTHPQVIWEFLATDVADRRRGILVHGPGGVGKTRLCLEVSARASEEGWRVLHLGPSEEILTERELVSVIGADSRPTLICLDYIDFTESADLIIGGTQLVRECASRGTRLRYLANSRPMWAQAAMRNADATSTFSFREICATEKVNERLLRQVMISVAPNALARWGHTELRRVCGGRPIISLLIAREIEDRLSRGLLDQKQLVAMRGGDLSAWLRRRLAQDELAVLPPISVWKTSGPSIEMIVASGALVAAPSNYETVVEAAASVIRSLNSDADASFVVKRLTTMGWLERQGSRLAAPHDVVTDEILDQVVRDVDEIRLAPLEAVMSVWECEPAAIGHLAITLQRWVGALPDGHPAAEKVKSASADWMRARASQIGAFLAKGGSGPAGYALGSIVKCPIWSVAIADCWDELVSLWIRDHGHLREARHLLYIGLNEDSLSSRLLAPALRWLGAFKGELEASYVLRRLLQREELQGEQLQEAISCALEWLAKHPLEKDAAFVIPKLLARASSQDGNLGRAIRYALAWLEEFPIEKDSGFVINALLVRAELKRKGLKEAVRCALEWLTHYPSELVAGSVISRLLYRNELKGAEFDAAVDRALDWLPGHLETKAAKFVLKHLMSRLLPPSPVRDERIRFLKKLAIDNLRQRVRNVNDQDVSSILHSWLRCQVLHADLDREIIALSCDWLVSAPKREGAEFVFNLVLRRTDASDRDWTVASRIASQWLCAPKRSLAGVGHTVNALLMRPALLPHTTLRAVVDAAFQVLPSIQGRYESELLRKRLTQSVLHLPPESPLAGEIQSRIALTCKPAERTSG